MEASVKDCCKQKNDCDELMSQRLRYFMGRHLTARDFTDEQAYHRTHRLFHNRILHGWGVVCGLDVRQHSKDDCRNKFYGTRGKDHAQEECGKTSEAVGLDSAPSACVSVWECMGDKRSIVPISGSSNIPFSKGGDTNFCCEQSRSTSFCCR